MKLNQLVWKLLVVVFSPLHIFGQNSKYSVTVNMPDPVSPPIIKSVTVTPENKNLITWQKVENINIQFFRIYRDSEAFSGGWVVAGNVPYSAKNEFLDKASISSFKPYRYRLAAIDFCGNEIFSNLAHKTIRLTIEQSKEQAYILKWNHYEGFEMDYYNIYKGSKNDTLKLVRTVPSNYSSLTDYENFEINTKYQVEAVAKPVSAKSGNEALRTRSNIVSTMLVLNLSDSANAGNLIIFPNPMAYSTMVIFPYSSDTPFTLSLINVNGQTVFTTEVYTGEYELHRGNLEAGLYILQVTGREVYRKKLIIGKI